MCFSIPKKIHTINGRTATLEDSTTVNLGAITASVGDYLLIYGNMAVEKISPKQALKTRSIMSTIDKLHQEA